MGFKEDFQRFTNKVVLLQSIEGEIDGLAKQLNEATPPISGDRISQLVDSTPIENLDTSLVTTNAMARQMPGTPAYYQYELVERASRVLDGAVRRRKRFGIDNEAALKEQATCRTAISKEKDSKSECDRLSTGSRFARIRDLKEQMASYDKQLAQARSELDENQARLNSDEVPQAKNASNVSIIPTLLLFFLVLAPLLSFLGVLIAIAIFGDDSGMVESLGSLVGVAVAVVLVVMFHKRRTGKKIGKSVARRNSAIADINVAIAQSTQKMNALSNQQSRVQSELNTLLADITPDIDRTVRHAWKEMLNNGVVALSRCSSFAKETLRVLRANASKIDGELLAQDYVNKKFWPDIKLINGIVQEGRAGNVEDALNRYIEEKTQREQFEQQMDFEREKAEKEAAARQAELREQERSNRENERIRRKESEENARHNRENERMQEEQQRKEDEWRKEQAERDERTAAASEDAARAAADSAREERWQSIVVSAEQRARQAGVKLAWENSTRFYDPTTKRLFDIDEL